MQDSILDRVMESREDQEKKQFDAVEVVSIVLKAVSEKEADVVRRRFGLHSAEKETLEQIGSQYQVTRERIRQIENQAIQKIRKSSSVKETVHAVEHLVISIMTHHGGVLTTELAQELLLGPNVHNEQYQRALHFILGQLLKGKVQSMKKKKQYRTGWVLAVTSMDFVDSATDVLVHAIEEIGHPATFEEVMDALKITPFYKEHEMQLSEEVVHSFMHISSKLGKNPFDEYGLSSWGRIQPKRMNDRVYLVLEKEGKPMHFEEIAKRISEVFEKKAYPPTVHNELILNEEYVLVGRGIYALKDWGYKEGVVSAVIEQVMKEAGRPMKRGEIIHEVLQQRMVKKNTIQLALTDKSRFAKDTDGRYMLAPVSDET